MKPEQILEGRAKAKWTWDKHVRTDQLLILHISNQDTSRCDDNCLPQPSDK